MKYDGPIDIDALVDLDELSRNGATHYTFFAFPKSSINDFGLPADTAAQHYIAAVQQAGVEIGIWLNSPVTDTGYAAVTCDQVPLLKNILENLLEFPRSEAYELSERLFENAARRF